MLDLYSTSFLLLSTVCIVLTVKSRQLLIPEAGATDAVDAMQLGKVKKLQTKYLTAFFLMMTGDWLQGPSTYPMYRGHGLGLVAIGRLFVVGYLSAAAMGPFVGSFCDKFGRKKASMTLCVTYSLCCACILSDNIFILGLGRVMGGISSSLIHSAPEAWLTSEHFSNGFSPSSLSITFALATFGNGLVAILTGLISDGVTNYGLELDEAPRLCAPFYCAIFFFMASMTIIYFTWTDNYGVAGNEDDVIPETALIPKLQIAVDTIWQDKAILATGMIQTLFETSMYIFVFLWGPVLESVSPGGRVPFGLVFSNLMLCLMIGSMAFRFMLARGYSGKDMARFQVTTASLCFFFPVFLRTLPIVYLCFLVFEFCAGIHFPLSGTLRSVYVPEEHRATIMNLFRFPCNVFTATSVLAVQVLPFSVLFGLCSVSVLVARVVAVELLLPTTPLKSEELDRKNDPLSRIEDNEK